MAIVWAYASYKYNWLNVGGGQSALKEFWIAASGVVPYIALAIWMAAVVLVAAKDGRRPVAATERLYRTATTIVMAPIVFFAADWLFHIGFPKSPV